MSSTLRYLFLPIMLLRNGRFKHSEFDFNARRNEILRPLKDHSDRIQKLLANTKPHQSHSNPYWFNLIAQGAYIKNSLKQRGGHLVGPGKLAYIRIPKAANTSVSWLMLSEKSTRLKTLQLTTEQINAIADLYLENEVNDTALTFFAVVRNPFERIVSVYRDFFEQHRNTFLYEDYLFGVFDRDMTFTQFVKRLRFIPDKLMDQHLRPQISFLRYYHRRKITPTILRLEDQSPLTSFFARFGLSLPRLNATPPYDYRSYYSTETFQIVRELYRKDVEIFDYRTEAKALGEALKK